MADNPKKNESDKSDKPDRKPLPPISPWLDQKSKEAEMKLPRPWRDD
jgi:hypothetical protein